LLSLYLNDLYINVDAEKYLIDKKLKLELVVEGLEQPISMAFLDNNDIIVLEKKGKVQRVFNNTISPSPVLDISYKVDSMRERGLLGIAISNGNNEIYEKSNKKERDVYLFFTELISKSDNFNFPCVLELCNKNNLVINSLYKYEFHDGKLVNPQLLLRVPINSNASLAHIGGVITISSDKVIYITSGDGNVCRNYESCKFSISEGLLNSQTSNSEYGIKPSGSGGILYLDTNDGVNNHIPIFGHEYPLNLYYAYGIRNSFGIDFDPVTGYLWDTENGPEFGDEINLVEPGFNSGWAKKQGMWPIIDYAQLSVDLLPGQTRGYNSNVQKQEIQNFENLVDFGGKGKYSDPEFTWNYPVGVTAIEFFNSSAYGEEYRNDMFVATFNDGLIYNFNLDKDRKNLDLNGKLTDKIANNDDELSDIIFAKNLSSITDLETGPDGFLYVVSPSKGTIWRIVPS